MKYLVRNNAVTHPDFNSLLLALLMRNRFLLSNNILGKPTDYKRTRPPCCPPAESVLQLRLMLSITTVMLGTQ